MQLLCSVIELLSVKRSSRLKMYICAIQSIHSIITMIGESIKHDKITSLDLFAVQIVFTFFYSLISFNLCPLLMYKCVSLPSSVPPLSPLLIDRSLTQFINRYFLHTFARPFWLTISSHYSNAFVLHVYIHNRICHISEHFPFIFFMRKTNMKISIFFFEFFFFGCY